MSKSKISLTPQLLEDILAATPEGFFHQFRLDQYDGEKDIIDGTIAAAVAGGRVGLEGEFLYDAVRLTADQVREWSKIHEGAFPQLRQNGTPAIQPVLERIKFRDDRLRKVDNKARSFLRLVDAFKNTPGYLAVEELCTQSGDEGALALLLDMGVLKKAGDQVFDPMRITRGTLNAIRSAQIIGPLRQQLVDLLAEKPGQTMPRSELVEQFGANQIGEIIEVGDFVVFTVPLPLGEMAWVRLRSADAKIAREIATEAVKPKDESWQAALDQCGDTVRQGTQEGETRREKVIARSYKLNAAAKRLDIHSDTLQKAILSRRISGFVDPEGETRLSVEAVESVLGNPAQHAFITELEIVRVRDLAIALNMPTQELSLKLSGKGLANTRTPTWGQVRDLLWETPITLADFHDLYVKRRREWEEARNAERDAAREADKQARQKERMDRRERERLQRDQERQQRREIRARLLAAFPTWQHSGRADQRMVLHIGPPNSGKTHSALDALEAAKNGWYLAPLRLLAFEVFERLNQRGVRCNLLTGEEFIPVDGATVTAATIEMFNPERSGDCVVIDEAQMLADPDRGWAWTRAMMEAQAPILHVMGPPTARDLIERLAVTAAMPIEVVEHARLAPLKVASQPWPLEKLPDRTILVAFSRRMVLNLKTELERKKRTVSVVYGNLPPEVRRKQADRFADSKTEICVATDAVGMGLNLPADHVCFYELQKYDGKRTRWLTPGEVHQIGGRAGRYGLSAAGEIGAINRRDLKALRELYEIAPAELTHARVAPVVDDLEMIPGNLAHRFAQWRELQSIPETLRDVIEPADIDERIALARLLTDAEVTRLGLASAVQLVNAPTREISRDYWMDCAHAILADRPMPLPRSAPDQIYTEADLDLTERAIACADIYLWLGNRREFRDVAPDEERVREVRTAWSMSIDAALLRKIDTSARCVNCGKTLPFGHRFSMCDDCYHTRSTGYWY